MANLKPISKIHNKTQLQKQWFVIYCKPNTEKKTAALLTECGIKVYCPVQIQMRQWSDRKKKVEVPVLPSMLMVHLKDNERAQVFQVPTVRRYLFWLNKPATVREEEIEKLKKALSENPKNVSVEKLSEDQKVKLKGLGFDEEDAKLKYTTKAYYCVYLERLGYVIKIKR